MPYLPDHSSEYLFLACWCVCHLLPHDDLLEGEAVYHICFAPPQCTPLFLQLLLLFSALNVISEKQLVVCPRLLIRGLMSPPSDIDVETPRLHQKGDLFGHHHGIRDCLPSYSRELYPPLKLLYQSGKGFYGVIGPHHPH